MREPPKLADATIIDALQTNYGILVSALTFMPIGADAASAAYRVQAADGVNYFLKIRTCQGFSESSLLVPQHLHNEGVPHIIAPLPTLNLALWVPVNEFVLSLFPFVEGQNAAEVGLSRRNWTELGAMVKRIHANRLPSDLLPIVPRESFIPIRREVLIHLEAVIEGGVLADAVQAELAGFWISRRQEIRSLVERADKLARGLRGGSSPPVLCHADLHAWNILLDSGEDFWLIDWDETILAPKERDLMFVMAGISHDLVTPQETACFLSGYGETDINPKALTYYRYAWAVQDMGACGEQVFFSPALGEESRRDAFEGFVKLFEPGSIVDIALASDNIRQ